jgi:hypothetical protein
MMTRRGRSGEDDLDGLPKIVVPVRGGSGMTIAVREPRAPQR